MHFLTEDTWELEDPIHNSLYGNQKRIYPCVELDLNRPLWHLDLQVQHGPVVEWRRLIFSSVLRLVATLREYPVDGTLHFQSARSHELGSQQKYEIWQVRTLSEGRDLAGRAVYLVDLGESSFQYPNPGSPVPALTEVECLYSATQQP